MRPVDKRFIGTGTGNIQVSSARFADGGTVTASLHIVEQKNPTLFKVTNGTKTEFLNLVDKSTGLDNGEFRVEVTLPDDIGSTHYVKKFYRNVLVADNGKRYDWEISDTAATATSPARVDSQ